MSIRFFPDEFLAKAAPTKKIERALKSNLSLKKSALTNASKFDFLDEKAIERVALKTIKGYKERVKEDPDLKDELLDDPAQLVQRVQNEVVFQVVGEIKDKYDGEFYTWLPSSADDPRPEHQLNYGKTFQLGVGDDNGEDPGDAWGCQCGMEILVDASSLDL